MEKIRKILSHCYVSQGPVLSLMGYFAVVKSKDDIRMVYNATKCKLNEAVWSPNSGLPTVSSVAHLIKSNTCLGNTDTGEMFLNYLLDLKIHPYLRVNIIMEAKKQQEVKHSL
eukprot:15353400-Ditylum_brightwellii.AAC.1